MEVLPPLLTPTVQTAQQLYNPLRAGALVINAAPNAAAIGDQVTRNTCLVALSAVGRCHWEPSRSGLEKARAGIYDWSIAVNCYTSVVMWAIIAGAITGVQQNGYVARLNAASGGPGRPGQAEAAEVKAILWDGVGQNGANRSQYSAANPMPLGAMVYFGRRAKVEADGNPLYHVGLHVGQGQVVGACLPVFDTAEGKKIVNDMFDLKLDPSTTIMTVEEMMGADIASVYHTNRPFWETFPG